MKQIIIIIISFIFGFSLSKFGCIKPQKVETEHKYKIDTLTKTYIDDNGVSHGEVVDVPVFDLNYSNLTEDYKEYVNNSIVPVLKTATDKLTELTRVNATLSGKLAASKKEIDEKENTITYYKDKYFEAMTINDSLVYKYNAILDIVGYSKGSGWFGNTKQYIDVSSPDTNLVINGVQRFKKEIPIYKPKLRLEGVISTIIIPNNSYISTGLGLKYNPHGLFSPSIETGFLSTTKKTYPFIGIKGVINIKDF